MRTPRSRGRAAVTTMAAAGALVLAAIPSMASTGASNTGPRGLDPHRLQAQNARQAATADEDEGDGGEGEELLMRDQQYAAVRTAPAASVDSAAFRAARRQAAALPAVAGHWSNLTDQPYNSDAVNYRDPFWSNSSGGAGMVSGRMSALATDGSTVYAGAADGGVWKSTDHGQHWRALFDNQDQISVGAVAVNPADHSVWVGTGEANTAFENYAGNGIFRSADGGATWQRVGRPLNNSLVSHLEFGRNGDVFASTSRGLLRHSLSGLTSPWQVVLKPDPNPTHSPYRTSFMTDVQVRPGNHHLIVAALGWRGATQPDDIKYNGFYVSRSDGAKGSWHRVTPHGIQQGHLGRTSFSYGRYGSNLYAVVEDPTTTFLTGVFRSATGRPSGPWTKIAGTAKLNRSGSALAQSPGNFVGQQAWYNQYIQVDPAHPGHLYLGLEEIFESTNYGRTWSTIGPYWNFPFACHSFDPQQDTCAKTTHPDQHSITIAKDGTVYVGNDGGIYSRKLSEHHNVRWNNLNADLHTLQYYFAGIGALPSGGVGIWGGLQDNGTSLLRGANADAMVSPFGGDGGDVIVDPKNAHRAVNEYVFLNMALTTNGGFSRGTASPKRVYRTISPSCFNVEFTPDPCDPNPRFIAPYEADPKNINHWVAGGQYVWDDHAGWNTVCTEDRCSWKKVHDVGDGGQITSIGLLGKTTYAGWCGNGCNPGGAAPFTSGIDTNFGGTWHRVHAPNLPNRIPTALTVDRNNPAHVYAVYGAFSRRWIPGGGVGHVFESKNGGATWVNRSGNLPDAPANDLLIWHGRLVVGTDVGVFSTAMANPGSWQRVGSDLPNASTNDLVLPPTGNYLVAATHGRGLWKFTG